MKGNTTKGLGSLSEVWRTRLTRDTLAEVNSPILLESQALLWNKKTLFSLDFGTGRPLWSVASGVNRFSQDAALLPDNQLLIGTTEGVLYIINLNSGSATTLRTFYAGLNVLRKGTSQKSVIVTAWNDEKTANSLVLLLDLPTLTERWRYELPLTTKVMTAEVIGRYVEIATHDEKLGWSFEVLDRETGKNLATISPRSHDFSAQHVDKDSVLFYSIAREGAKSRASRQLFNLANGKMVESADGAICDTTSFAIDSGTQYAVCGEPPCRLVARDLALDRLIWQTDCLDIPTGHIYAGSTLHLASTFVVANVSGNVVACDRSDGHILYECQLLGTSVVTRRDNLLIVDANASEVRLLTRPPDRKE